MMAGPLSPLASAAKIRASANQVALILMRATIPLRAREFALVIKSPLKEYLLITLILAVMEFPKFLATLPELLVTD